MGSFTPFLHTQWLAHPEYKFGTFTLNIPVDVCDSIKPVWSNTDIWFAIKGSSNGAIHIRSKKFANFNNDLFIFLERLGSLLSKRIKGLDTHTEQLNNKSI